MRNSQVTKSDWKKVRCNKPRLDLQGLMSSMGWMRHSRVGLPWIYCMYHKGVFSDILFAVYLTVPYIIVFYVYKYNVIPYLLSRALYMWHSLTNTYYVPSLWFRSGVGRYVHRYWLKQKSRTLYYSFHIFTIAAYIYYNWRHIH